ncbi:MAG: bifunctional demethylmenaquinone methyltransferase/2-methoxy-6-polyprenyl-1,4-benzoquinol methylase UbiE [Bacteroidales bacterium]|jgi:demethylmenaquinone methyltransferase/2-methoxy-6-polyprenyl-1,4-benzoquinol methylase|nr:bifunctional demethylmenaquinone methyltransferase/2-methoxy-6-polyprenyl-1,4-benzoquinol methylase UbiE [Bacteroidales bacterium]MCI1784702.1 bifunctional demethylmenaquinone methyltransferase/2-methoxy-6-polyprenyl-1,4-benzoquinol methylase UbiE [Bacteroidales bacterium]
MPKKENIHQLFDSISPEYDRLNHILSMDIDKIWRKKAVRKIISGNNGESETAGQPLHILDVACGTGDFSIAIAGQMPEGSHVTGIDLSEGMLAIMDGKIRKAGMQDQISWMQGDCEALPFDDCTFDRVSVAFGVRNFENREKGLKEMLRILKPEGRLVILELSVPSNRILRWLFNLYFLNILPLVGGKVSGDKAAYKYLPASVLNFPDKKSFMKTLTDCGYREVSHKAFSMGICRMYTGEK